MTEEEAKTKWCPFGRVLSTVLDDNIVPGIPAFNRRATQSGHVDAVGACIASACMAWRATPAGKRTERDFGATAPEDWKEQNFTLHPEPSDIGRRYYSRVVDVPAGGFCGLAGAPQ